MTKIGTKLIEILKMNHENHSTNLNTIQSSSNEGSDMEEEELISSSTTSFMNTTTNDQQSGKRP